MREHTLKTKPAHRDLAKELSKARMIQKLLLPQAFPEIAGLRMAYRYVPVYELAGDFVDYYYKRHTNELGFVVCDVSGHGIPAALISAMLKMSLSLWGEYIEDPQGTLLKMRRLLTGKLGDDFVTAIIGYVDLETGLLRCVNAGHTPLLRIGLDGQAQPIKPEGRIIHESLQHKADLFEGRLAHGDRLVLFTDGLTEVTDDRGQMLGEEGLALWLGGLTDHQPEAACEQILEKLFAYAGPRGLTDDCTLLVIDYL